METSNGSGVRVRVNITKNTRGYSYDFTVESSRQGDDFITDGHRAQVLQDVEDMKAALDSKIWQWTLDDAENG